MGLPLKGRRREEAVEVRQEFRTNQDLVMDSLLLRLRGGIEAKRQAFGNRVIFMATTFLYFREIFDERLNGTNKK